MVSTFQRYRTVLEGATSEGRAFSYPYKVETDVDTPATGPIEQPLRPALELGEANRVLSEWMVKGMSDSLSLRTACRFAHNAE